MNMRKKKKCGRLALRGGEGNLEKLWKTGKDNGKKRDEY